MEETARWIFVCLVPVDQIGFWGGSRTGLEGGRIQEYLSIVMESHQGQGLRHLYLQTCRGLEWLGSISWAAGRVWEAAHRKCHSRYSDRNCLNFGWSSLTLENKFCLRKALSLKCNNFTKAWVTRKGHNLN